MLDKEILSRIAQEMMTADDVHVNGERLTVARTSVQHLRSVAFTLDGQEYQAIEQNPDKPSRWGQMAKKGHKVVQFKEEVTNKFVAVSVDGKVKLYTRD